MTPACHQNVLELLIFDAKTKNNWRDRVKRTGKIIGGFKEKIRPWDFAKCLICPVEAHGS